MKSVSVLGVWIMVPHHIYVHDENYSMFLRNISKKSNWLEIIRYSHKIVVSGNKLQSGLQNYTE